MEKKCTRCETVKPLEQFSKSKQVKSGYGAWCKLCSNAARKESADRVRALDPDGYSERRRGYVAKYRLTNSDKVREHERKAHLKKVYGITVERYDALLSAQGGVCAGCQSKPANRRFAVDHDHSCCPDRTSCGECIRGLLCSNCNTAIGLLKEDRETIARLLEYLEN